MKTFFFTAFLLLYNTAFTYGDQWTLYVVHAPWCGPCNKFRQDYFNNSQFRNKLESRFAVKSCEWEKASEQRWARRHGISNLPGFIVYRNGKCEQVFVGYNGDWQSFLAKLNLDISEVVPPTVRGRDSPDVVERQSREKSESGNQASPRPITPEEKELPRISAMEVEISNLRKLLAQLAEQSREFGSRQTTTTDKKEVSPFSDDFDFIFQPPLQQPTTQSKSERVVGGAQRPLTESPTSPPNVPSEASSSENLAKSWGSVLSTAGTAALTLLAPQVALPAGALSVAGLGVQLLRRRLAAAAERRKPKPAAGTREDPIVVPLPQQPVTRTETKYVIQETDLIGEAYKEALRRVANANEQNPEVMESLKQVESAASQLIHGQRVVRRPKKDAAESPSEVT